MTHKDRLEELRKQLREATEFQKVYTYFFDHLGENEEFLSNGERIDHPLLEATLKGIVETLLKKTVAPSFLFVRVHGEPFIHGSCIVAGHLMTYFFFEDIAQGMTAVVSLSQRTKTHFIRFATELRRPPPKPSTN